VDAAILDLLEQVSSEKDEGKKAELKARSNARLSAHFSRVPSDLEELAFDLLNIAWADTMQEDLVPKLIETRTVGINEVDYIEEDLRGGRAYWQGKGGQIRSFILRYERERMPVEEMVTSVELHIDEIRSNFWGGYDKLKAQANEKLRQLPTRRLIELVQAAVNDTSNSTYYGEFAKSTLTDDQVDSVLEPVLERAKSGVSILGTLSSLTPFAKIGAQFSENVADQVFKTGGIGVYKGVPLVQVENFEDFAGNLVLPTDEVLIVGRNAGRLTFYGADAKVQQLNERRHVAPRRLEGAARAAQAHLTGRARRRAHQGMIRGGGYDASAPLRRGHLHHHQEDPREHRDRAGAEGVREHDGHHHRCRPHPPRPAAEGHPREGGGDRLAQRRRAQGDSERAALERQQPLRERRLPPRP
jgi:hypothetical protein